jgi:serine/threonine-protein kinase
VTLKVSTGPSPKAAKAVPDVVGEDQQTATADLRAAGFAVQVFTTPVTDQTQNGLVVDQQPEGGTQAPTGSQITIYVGQFSG